ncbi:unnamed protein product [Candida verbasci]|uniref:Copper-fist domain-containing protein n=1 Tax=Candida verbasci TaxID=1227364 RepID=A0A9W4TTJ1_9ASCO|nr:unnamed protein product [Candida verbasci]
MVLINGVKYACERCIRGHRVTTCTHTDQPLTMIKPKGRPATQCQHCRENRKHKNLHVSCTCGKKGKPPSVHSSSCACSKTNHCTCSSNNSKKTGNGKSDIRHMSASEKAKKKSLIDAANADIRKRSESVQSNSDSSPGSTTSGLPQQQQEQHLTFNNIQDQNYVIEDVLIPFDTNNGLFDLFPSSTQSETTDSVHDFKQEDLQSNNTNTNTNTTNPGIHTSLKNDSHLSPGEIEVVDHMFPLFPLVGTQSFQNENQPLSPFSNNQKVVPEQPKPVRPTVNATRMSSSSASLFNDHHNQQQHQQQQPKPKRPESVLSITSNSSTRSFDFMGTGFQNINSYSNGNLPASSNSAAFPPSNTFDEMQNNSGNVSDDGSMHLHFGRTGLGSQKFGSQLSKIESEMYTENFFDDQLANNQQQQQQQHQQHQQQQQQQQQQPPSLSTSSSIPNFYETNTYQQNQKQSSTSDLTYTSINDGNLKFNESTSDLNFDNRGSTTPFDYDLPYHDLFVPFIPTNHKENGEIQK